MLIIRLGVKMTQKKRIVYFSILSGLGLLLLLVALFVPTVQIVAKNTSEEIVYNKSVNLIQYLIDSPFWLTDAFDIYFNANGPIWLATASILFNFLLAVGGLVMFVVCLIEICTCKVQNMAIKNNILAKKISLFIGWFTVSVTIFAAVSFIVTTMMANGYAQFNLSVATFAFLGIGAIMIVIAHLTDKRTEQQQTSKIKDSLGFGLSGLLSLFGVGLLFIPQYSVEFGLGVTSLWDVGRAATLIMSDAYIFKTAGDYPFGFATWVMFLLFFVTIFIFIYSLIGFICSLCGKSTLWLSSRVKRWSMTYLIVYSILYMFVLCQSAVWWSTAVIVETDATFFSLMPYAYVLMFVPYLPYIFSTMIAFNKKEKVKKVKEIELQNKN